MASNMPWFPGILLSSKFFISSSFVSMNLISQTTWSSSKLVKSREQSNPHITHNWLTRKDPKGNRCSGSAHWSALQEWSAAGAMNQSHLGNSLTSPVSRTFVFSKLPRWFFWSIDIMLLVVLYNNLLKYNMKMWCYIIVTTIDESQRLPLKLCLPQSKLILFIYKAFAVPEKSALQYKIFPT